MDEDPKPIAPNPDDYSGCCDSGCNPCVFDLYWDAVARYELALAAWQERNPGAGSATDNATGS